MSRVSSEIETEKGAGEHDSLDDPFQIPAAYYPRFFDTPVGAGVVFGFIVLGFIVAVWSGLV
jgi:hypothetical protein